MCLVTLELWLLDMYSFVVFLLWQKTNLTIFKRNCFTLVLRILITIIPAAVLNRHKIIYVYCAWCYGIMYPKTASLTVHSVVTTFKLELDFKSWTLIATKTKRIPPTYVHFLVYYLCKCFVRPCVLLIFVPFFAGLILAFKALRENYYWTRLSGIMKTAKSAKKTRSKS